MYVIDGPVQVARFAMHRVYIDSMKSYCTVQSLYLALVWCSVVWRIYP